MKVIVILVAILIDLFKSIVVIEGPQELMKYFNSKTGKDNITANYANFGRIPYGFQIVFYS